MKKILLILLFAGSYSCLNHASAQSSSSEIKGLLIGKWVLANDKNFVMSIKKDSLIYCYKRKVTDRKPIIFLFSDSVLHYKNKIGAFDFLKGNGDLYPGIVIKEYDPIKKDTTDITIIYINNKGMDLMSGGRTATFNKIK
jgi:hypothetical protein